MRIRALQSGTSADGIDHVTASFTPHGDVLHVRVEDHGTAPMLSLIHISEPTRPY